MYNAFLKGNLHEEVYMTLSDRFGSQEENKKVRRLINIWAQKRHDNGTPNSQKDLFRQISLNPRMITFS